MWSCGWSPASPARPAPVWLLTESENMPCSQVQWYRPAIPALGKLRLAGVKFPLRRGEERLKTKTS